MKMVNNMAGDRVNYLSIALRARGAIKTLKSLNSANQRVLVPEGDLQYYLGDLVNWLKAASSKSLHSKLSSEATYRRFEEVQTLDEVTKAFKNVQLLPHLEALLQGKCDEEDVRTAIKLSSAIERRALYYYNDPSLAETGM